MSIHIKNKAVEEKIRALAEKQNTSYVQAVNNAVTYLLENSGNTPLNTKDKEAQFTIGVQWLKTSAWPYMHQSTGMSDEEIAEVLGYNDMI